MWFKMPQIQLLLSSSVSDGRACGNCIYLRWAGCTTVKKIRRYQNAEGFIESHAQLSSEVSIMNKPNLWRNSWALSGTTRPSDCLKNRFLKTGGHAGLGCRSPYRSATASWNCSLQSRWSACAWGWGREADSLGYVLEAKTALSTPRLVTAQPWLESSP